MKYLKSQWILKKVPAVNGVISVDGHIHHVKPVDPPRSLPLFLQIDKESELDTCVDLLWVSVFPFESVVDQKTGRVAVAGECGMGSDGFVALQKNSSADSLLWIAFFDFSNPFESIGFETDGFLVARNNLHEEWRLNLTEPWRINVTAALTRSA